MDSNTSPQNITVEECRKIVEEMISLISASGSVSSGLVNARVARAAIYIASLTFILSLALFLISVTSLIFADIKSSTMALVILITTLIPIIMITRWFYDIERKESGSYLKKAKGSLFVIENLLKNRRETLEHCLGLCSGKLCDDIRELIKYYSKGVILDCIERQS